MLIYLPTGRRELNVKVATFNQEKALVGAFFVIVQLHRLIGYTALVVSGKCNYRFSIIWCMYYCTVVRSSLVGASMDK